MKLGAVKRIRAGRLGFARGEDVATKGKGTWDCASSRQKGGGEGRKRGGSPQMICIID